MNANNVIAAILTLAGCQSGAIRASDHDEVFAAYQKFGELIKNDQAQRNRNQIPVGLEPLYEEALKLK